MRKPVITFDSTHFENTKKKLCSLFWQLYSLAAISSLARWLRFTRARYWSWPALDLDHQVNALSLAFELSVFLCDFLNYAKYPAPKTVSRSRVSLCSLISRVSVLYHEFAFFCALLHAPRSLLVAAHRVTHPRAYSFLYVHRTL